jgi:GYF domain 2
MGIRFLCPSGHKLNVKSFLAGKRGICPHCGAKFEIPFESVASAPPPPAAGRSVAASNARSAAKAGPVAQTTSSAGSPAIAAPAIASSPLAPVSPAAPGISMTGADKAGPAAPAGIPPVASTPAAATAVKPTAVSPLSPAPVSPAAGPDPIAEAPSAVWYVRTNTGGQFGPARGDMIRQWLDERRIGPDYLVWREGWPEWRRAAAIFAMLAVPGAIGPGGPNVTAPTAGAPRMEDDWVEAIIESQSHPTVHKPRAKPSRNNNLLLAISFVVVLLGVILVVVVIIAANRQMHDRESPPNSSPPSNTSTSRLPFPNSLLAGTTGPRGLECGSTRVAEQMGDIS